jgi:titin
MSTTRSSGSIRKAHRALLCVESLESRELLSGNTWMPMLAPSSATATAINLSWTMPTWGTYNYLVDMQGPGSNGLWEQIANPQSVVGNPVNYTAPGLSADTTYCFRVGEYTSADPNTYWSNNEYAATMPLAMTTPSVTATAVSPTRVNLTWNSVAGASGYNIYEGANATAPFTSVDSSKTSYSFTNLSPGTTYYFGVGAFNQGSTSLPNMQAVTTLPAVPAFTLQAWTPTEVGLSWNSAAGASGYVVDWWSNTNSGSVRLSGNNNNFYFANNLTPGTSYTFQVGAYNATGTSWANAQSMITLPADPSFTLMTISPTQIDVFWNSEAGANGYLVQEWVNGAWKQIANPGTSTNKLEVTGLTPNTSYFFDVIAYNASGYSWADVAQSAFTAPATPTFSATAVSASQINLAWNSVAGANSYVIQEWTSNGFAPIIVVSGTSTTYSATGLNANTTYYFEVFAQNAGGEGYANTESALTVPAAPLFSFTGVSTTQLNISWNYVAGASGYLIDEWVNGAWQQIANLPNYSTSAPITDYLVTGLNPGSTYYFDVSAYNASGVSWANYQSVTTVSLPVRRPVAAVDDSLTSNALAAAGLLE